MKSCSENEKHLQKTMHYNTKCDGAVARASVSFFCLLTGMFLIALWKSRCHRLLVETMLRAGWYHIEERYGIGFSDEAITSDFLANKKMILLLAFLDFVGAKM
jgi:hypothetical protein